MESRTNCGTFGPIVDNRENKWHTCSKTWREAMNERKNFWDAQRLVPSAWPSGWFHHVLFWVGVPLSLILIILLTTVLHPGFVVLMPVACLAAYVEVSNLRAMVRNRKAVKELRAEMATFLDTINADPKEGKS
jgi:Flp pilus assembly protein TadB